MATSEIADTSRRERLERLRRIAWLLDNSIPLPGGFRVGLDAVVGLLPGVGDAMSARAFASSDASGSLPQLATAKRAIIASAAFIAC